MYAERNGLVDFNEQKHMASSVEKHGQHLQGTTPTFIYLAFIYLTFWMAWLLDLVLHPELQNL